MEISLQDQIKLLIGSLVCCVDGECSDCPRYNNGINEYHACARQLRMDADEMVDFLDKCSRVAGGGKK